jgi:hypothetical protein
MKTLKLITLGIFMLFVSNAVQAQLSVNVQIGTAPSWGPVGYASADYYYLPDIEAYYDIRQTQFIFLSSGNWIRSRNLPGRYRNYDLNRGYKVVLNDYHGSRPYGYYKIHKQKYYKGYKGKPQKSIGYANKNHNNNGNHNNNNGNKGNKGNGHKKN